MHLRSLLVDYASFTRSMPFLCMKRCKNGMMFQLSFPDSARAYIIMNSIFVFYERTTARQTEGDKGGRVTQSLTS